MRRPGNHKPSADQLRRQKSGGRAGGGEMIERCLIIDTETNGTDLQMCNAIEFGAVLYSVKERAALGQVSFLDHWEVSAEIESITGITQRLLDEAKETRRQFYAQAYLV